MRLALNLTKFDESPFEPYLQRTAAAGTALATLAEVGDLPGHRRRLYELNKTCLADIPERATFCSFDEYVAQRLEVPAFDPCGVVLAVQDDRWVGFATTSIHHAKGYAFSEMTGALRTHRGRGVSMALKVMGIRFASSSGMPCCEPSTIRTMPLRLP